MKRPSKKILVTVAFVAGVSGSATVASGALFTSTAAATGNTVAAHVLPSPITVTSETDNGTYGQAINIVLDVAGGANAGNAYSRTYYCGVGWTGWVWDSAISGAYIVVAGQDANGHVAGYEQIEGVINGGVPTAPVWPGGTSQYALNHGSPAC